MTPCLVDGVWLVIGVLEVEWVVHGCVWVRIWCGFMVVFGYGGVWVVVEGYSGA